MCLGKSVCFITGDRFAHGASKIFPPSEKVEKRAECIWSSQGRINLEKGEVARDVILGNLPENLDKISFPGWRHVQWSTKTSWRGQCWHPGASASTLAVWTEHGRICSITSQRDIWWMFLTSRCQGLHWRIIHDSRLLVWHAQHPVQSLDLKISCVYCTPYLCLACHKDHYNNSIIFYKYSIIILKSKQGCHYHPEYVEGVNKQ